MIFDGSQAFDLYHMLLITNLHLKMVIYIVCYDFSASQEVRNEQRAYWLNFLQSTLSAPSSTNSKWQVLVTGTKSDKSDSHKDSYDPIPSWQQNWPNLPFHKQHFIVSSFEMSGVRRL